MSSRAAKKTNPSNEAPEPFVGFLRGVNVGGHTVRSPELIEAFCSAGCSGVETFLASGNVFFTTTDTPERAQSRIDKSLSQSFGFPLPFTARTGSQTAQIASSEVFTADELESSSGKLQVILIDRHISPSDEAHINAAAGPDDLLRTGTREIYWLPAQGLSDSALDFDSLLKHFGFITTRTHNTIARITKKFGLGEYRSPTS